MKTLIFFDQTKKFNGLKPGIILFIVIWCFFSSLSSVNANKINLTGTWILNEEKSELGQNSRASNKIVITQDENNLVLERTGTRRSGESFTTAEKLTLDGKECTNVVFGDREKKSTAIISEDGLSITIKSTMVFEREGEKMEVNSTEIFKLDNDAKTLVIDSSSISQRGERKNKFVYDLIE